MGGPQREWPYLDKKGPATTCRREDELREGGSACPSLGLSLLSGVIDVAGDASGECQQEEDEGGNDGDVDESGVVVQVGAPVHHRASEPGIAR